MTTAAFESARQVESERRTARLRRPDARRRAGFVVTLTAILVFTILVIGVLVGIAALRNALIQRAGVNVIKEADGTPFAKPLDFGICEEPLIKCKDPANGLIPIVGVRPTHFTTRNQVFYDAPGCVGTPYLAPPAVPAPDGVFPPELPVGYLNGSLLLDGTGTRIAYGVGSPTDWGGACTELPCTDGGRLYRGDGAVAATAIQSVWTSLAPDCGGGGDDGGAPADPPVDLVSYEFTGNLGTPTILDPSVTATVMIPANLPVTPSAPPGYAQIGTTPSSGCNCSTALACVCDDDGSPAFATYFDYLLAGTATAAVAAPATTLTDAAADFSVVPTVGATVANTTDGSSSSVVLINSPTQLTHTALAGGAENDWDVGESYEVTGTNSYLEFSVSCVTGTLSSVSVQMNARKVSSNVQETGFLHVLSSIDGFATVDADVTSAPLNQMLATVYTFALGDPGAATLGLRIHPERTGGSQSRFDVRLDDVVFSAACAAGGGGGGGGQELCADVSATHDLVPATEVVDGGGANVLSPFTPLFSIMPSMLTFTPAAAEDAPLAGGGTSDPGSPIVLPPGTSEDAAPLPEDAPGETPPGPAPTFPDPDPEGG